MVPVRPATCISGDVYMRRIVTVLESRIVVVCMMSSLAGISLPPTAYTTKLEEPRTALGSVTWGAEGAQTGGSRPMARDGPGAGDGRKGGNMTELNPLSFGLQQSSASLVLNAEPAADKRPRPQSSPEAVGEERPIVTRSHCSRLFLRIRLCRRLSASN